MPQGLVAETATRIFADLAEPQAVIAAGKDAWKAPLWRTLTENGLTGAWTPEAFGGVDVGLAEGFEVAFAAGRFALAAPLLETMLAGWLLGRAGMAPPEGAITVGPVRPRDVPPRLEAGRLWGRARALPFAPECGHLALYAAGEDGPVVMLVKREAARETVGSGLAGDPRSDLRFDGVVPVASAAPNPTDVLAFQLMGGAVRSLQIAGALQAILERTVAYANEREAFGKPIGKFQAVQVNVARLAGEAAAASAAATSAADALATTDRWEAEVFLEVAAAKVRCAEAAQVAVAIAHQVHGAIGLTLEHPLHRFTLRALEWRDDFGDESYWAVQLGRRIAAAGAAAVWPLVASR